jgi:hypothetical protein
MLGAAALLINPLPPSKKTTCLYFKELTARGLIICEMFDKTLSLTPTLVP